MKDCRFIVIVLAVPDDYGLHELKYVSLPEPIIKGKPHEIH